MQREHAVDVIPRAVARSPLGTDLERIHTWLDARLAGHEGGRGAFEEAYARDAGQLKKSLLIAFAPLFAVPLALVMWRRDRYFADHVVFVLHMLSAGMLLMAVLRSVNQAWRWLASREGWTGGSADNAFVAVLLVGLMVGGVAYAFLALRRAYPEALTGTLLRGLLLLFVAMGATELFWVSRVLAAVWWLS